VEPEAPAVGEPWGPAQTLREALGVEALPPIVPEEEVNQAEAA